MLPFPLSNLMLVLLLSLFKHYCSSLVLPHLTYCPSIWDPLPSSINAQSLEKVQFFALKMCSHCWDSNYTSLLSSFQVPFITPMIPTQASFPLQILQ